MMGGGGGGGLGDIAEGQHLMSHEALLCDGGGGEGGHSSYCSHLFSPSAEEPRAVPPRQRRLLDGFMFLLTQRTKDDGSSGGCVAWYLSHWYGVWACAVSVIYMRT